MDLQAAIEGLVGALSAVLLAFAWWIRHSGVRGDRKLEDARREHRDALTKSDERCRNENEKIIERLRQLEDGRHREAREDQKRLVEIIAQYGDDHRAAAHITSEGNKALARAVEKLADRMPDPTPPRGSRTA